MAEKLIKKFEDYELCLEEERFEDIDFDELKSDLKRAAEVLVGLEQKGKSCDKLLLDFKGEMMRMCLAISKAKQEEDINSSLTEKLILSDLSFEEMVGLRKQLRDEFNRCFVVSPQYQIKDENKEKMEINPFKS